MNNKKQKLKCNIFFQKEKDYEINDTRFAKVKIWLMHLGINNNGTSFNRECVENAIPTLANTPILGYVEKNNGEKDFSDHRMEIKFIDGNKKEYIYQGQAYGVIPENNNAHFEKRICDDGIEREFLVVDGLLWNKLSDSIDILNRDLWKSQSMELADGEGDYEGEYDENFIYHFKKFKFYGACFLGDKYEPAMENARIELNNYSKLKDGIKEQLKKFDKFIENEKGGIFVNKEKEQIQCVDSNKNTESINENSDVKEKQDNTIEDATNTNVISNGIDPNDDKKKNKKEQTQMSNIQYEIELKNKDREISKLQYEIELRNKEIERINNEFADYKEIIELEKKKELLDEYLEMLENDSEYKTLLDETKLKEFTADRLKERLDSLVGRKARKQYSFNKENGINSDTKYYFEQNDNEVSLSFNSPFGGLVDKLMNME